MHYKGARGGLGGAGKSRKYKTIEKENSGKRDTILAGGEESEPVMG